jgi:hypothetical protein
MRRSVRSMRSIKWMRLSCRTFAAQAVRLHRYALACNLANLMLTLAMPDLIKNHFLDPR